MNEARCEFLRQRIIRRAELIEAHARMLKLDEDDGTNPAVCAVNAFTDAQELADAVCMTRLIGLTTMQQRAKGK